MWNEYKTVEIYTNEIKVKDKYKLLILDLDGTLITRKNGKIPFYQETDSNNWVFLGKIKKILQYYNERGYLIVIITNQSRFTQIIKNKTISVINSLSLENIMVMILKSKDDEFRKPNIGSINLLLNLLNVQNIEYSLFKDIPFDRINNCGSIIKKIIVSGDAIDANDEYPPYRWSNVDYMLYENIRNIFPKTKFIRPIDLFPSNEELLLEKIKQDVVILVGNQGSGKSTFSQKLSESKGYVSLSQDLLKTHAKVLKMAKENIKKGNKIIIDATNSTIDKRKIWIDLSTSSCIVWIIRDGYQFNKYRDKPVPNIAYNIYTKHFQEPTNEETKVYKLW